MVNSAYPSGHRVRFLDRLAAWRATRSRRPVDLVARPQPHAVGSVARGRELMAGQFAFAGYAIVVPDAAIWDLPGPEAGFTAELHGFAWLDDLAALGDAAARARAQDWLDDWIRRFGQGRGPGWTPELAGRRVLRWIHHAPFVMPGRREAGARAAFHRSLAQQTLFLARRWQAARLGLARFEALAGLICAGVALDGMERHVDPAIRALGHEAAMRIDAGGGLSSRNPEELLEVLTLLGWTAAVLGESGRSPGPEHRRAIARIAPVLRRLRHADGGLARFHGGGRGGEGRLDGALAASGVRNPAPGPLAMGFARLAAGRTSLIIDAAPPPSGPGSAGAHASTLAFELTSGRRPLIVNCGAGARFGRDWRRAGRATPSHSTLVLADRSSARLGSGRLSRTWLTEAPRHVPVEISATGTGLRFEGAQDGYVARFGLTHARRLEMRAGGRGIIGEDLLLALGQAQERQISRVLARQGLGGLPYAIRFHLHPDVEPTADPAGRAVHLALRSGETWVFRNEGRAVMTLEPSVYLDRSRAAPRPTRQIVLSGLLRDTAMRAPWSLMKTEDTPVAIRDLRPDPPDPADPAEEV